MNALEELGYKEEKLATGIYQYTKENEYTLYVENYNRYAQEYHDVALAEEWQTTYDVAPFVLSQKVLLAWAEVVKEKQGEHDETSSNA